MFSDLRLEAIKTYNKDQEAKKRTENEAAEKMTEAKKYWKKYAIKSVEGTLKVVFGEKNFVWYVRNVGIYLPPDEKYGKLQQVYLSDSEMPSRAEIRIRVRPNTDFVSYIGHSSTTSGKIVRNLLELAEAMTCDGNLVPEQWPAQ